MQNTLMEQPDNFEHMIVPKNYGGSIYMLIVEDCDEDAELLRLGFEEARCSNTIEHLHTADETWERILNNKLRRPDWIIIDLNLIGSKMSGWELVEKIGANPERFKTSRLVAVSGQPITPEEEDKLYFNKVNAFFLKPLKIENIFHMIKTKPDKVKIDFYKEHEVA